MHPRSQVTLPVRTVYTHKVGSSNTAKLCVCVVAKARMCESAGEKSAVATNPEIQNS